MKKSVCVILFCICVIANVFAQSSRETDSTRLDSSWTSSRHLPYLQSILQAPVLNGTSSPENITPTGQKICFDKVLQIKSFTDRGPVEMCLFLNTKIGLVGYNALRPGVTAICDIKPEDPDFNLNIIGLKGNVYTYSNQKKDGEIRHWVSTGKTNKHSYQFTQSGSSAQVYKKTERRDYCGGKIKTWCYKYDGRPEQWFLFGKNYPNSVRMEPLKYLGNFALGFQYTDKGLFIIMEFVSSSYSAKIVDIRDVNICFDPSRFKILEDDITSQQQQFIRKERARLDADAARVAGKPCAEIEMERINYQRSLLDQMEQDIDITNQQNIYQSDLQTHQRMASLTMNHNGMIQSIIYETKYKICLAERQISEANARGSDVSSYQRKLDCLRRQLENQQRIQREMEALDRQFARDPNMAFIRKSQLMLQSTIGCD